MTIDKTRLDLDANAALQKLSDANADIDAIVGHETDPVFIGNLLKMYAAMLQAAEDADAK